MATRQYSPTLAKSVINVSTKRGYHFSERDQICDEGDDLPVRELVRVVLVAQRHLADHRRLLRRQRLRNEAGHNRLYHLHTFRWITNVY